MNIRGIELFVEDSGQTVNPESLIGIDETGTHNVPGPFAIAAVLCPREAEPQLAEKMINAGMNLWKEKPNEELFLQSDLLGYIKEHPDISWFAIGSTSPISVDEKAAAASVAARYTLIQPNVSWTYSVDEAALIHDGSENMYGKSQIQLRRQLSAQLDSEFRNDFGDLFLTQTPSGDQIYPCVMLADLISGQVSKQISEGRDIGNEVTNCEWFKQTWVEGNKGKIADLYYLDEAGGLYDDYLWENFSAWLQGKSSPGSDGRREALSVETLIKRSQGSEAVAEYLRRNRK